MFNSEILLRISKEVGAPVSRVETTLKLLEEGATVPFIARYRKEATGNLDEVKIRDIDEKRQYYKDLEERRATILASIEKQGKLTDELKAEDSRLLHQERTRRSLPSFQAEAEKQRPALRWSVAWNRWRSTSGNRRERGPSKTCAQQFVNPEKGSSNG